MLVEIQDLFFFVFFLYKFQQVFQPKWPYKVFVSVLLRDQ